MMNWTMTSVKLLFLCAILSELIAFSTGNHENVSALTFTGTVLSERPSNTRDTTESIHYILHQTAEVQASMKSPALETNSTEGTIMATQEVSIKPRLKPEPPSLFPVLSTMQPNLSIIRESTRTIQNENEPSNYFCPPECDCWLNVVPSRYLSITCSLQHINEMTNFDVFNRTVLSSTLTLLCDPLRLMKSKLHPYMFRGLHSCIALTILDCQFDYLPEKTFYGMTTLRELKIYNAAEITFHTAAFETIPFLEELSIIQSGMSSAPSLCRLHNLRLVNFTDNNIGTLDETGLLCDAPFKNLQVIDLCKNNLRKIVINISDISDNLLHLSACDNKIEQILEHAFRGLYFLSSVDIGNNLIASLSSYIFQDVNGLEVLNLNKNRLTNVSSGLLSHLQNLTVLDLSDLSLNMPIFNEIKNLHNLQKLVLKNNCIENIKMSSLSHFSRMKYLDISDNDIRILAPNIFMSLQNLEELHISGNIIETISKDAFNGLSKVFFLALERNKIRTLHRECLQPLLALSVLNLSYNAIEKLPSFQGLHNLLYLDLRHNNIKLLDNSTFAGTSGIVVINLNNNRIKTIRARTVKYLRRLENLYIKNNEIDDVEYDAFGDTTIEYLNLRNNNISDINFFQHSNFAGLRKLDLSYNNIRQNISSNFFRTFQGIEHLFISNNKIQGVYSGAFESLLNLQSLDISYNEIRHLDETALKTSSIFTTISLTGNPFNCDCNMQWIQKWQLYPKLNDKHLIDLSTITCTIFDGTSDSLLYRDAIEDFLCQYERECNAYKCSCCNSDACACLHICPDKCACFHRVDGSVNLIRCERKGFDQVPEEIPPASTHLYLDGNNISVVSIYDFPKMSHLEYLSMNDSNIHAIHDYTFAKLSLMKTLHLNGNSISTISSKTFFGLNKLQRLSLSKNRITFIESGSFSQVPEIYYLDLSKNLLHEVEGSVLYEISFASSLNLSGNPWTCDCEFIKHFVNFMYSNVKRLKDFSELTCTTKTTSPTNTTINLSDTLLLDLCPVINVRQSKELTHNVIMVSMLTTLLVAVVIVVIFVFAIFRNRDFLEVWIYVKFGWRICNKEEDQTDAYKPYDAFVSYSSKDEYYVVHELVPVLENDLNYRLCVHYRDFPVGAAIADNIVFSIESSKRVIMVLSNNFVESDWCHYEFHIAHQRLLAEKKNRIIMILLDNIDKSKLVPELKDYIQTNTYVHQNDAWFWEKIKYAMP